MCTALSFCLQPKMLRMVKRCIHAEQVKKKFFYLDADRFPDKALLAALTPPEPSAAGTIPR